MATLGEQVTKEPVRAVVVKDCVGLVDSEVASKRGMGGLAVKGAYKTIKAIKPGFVTGVVDALLDEWIAELEPAYAEYVSQGSQGTFGAYISGRPTEIATALLRVTDGRAERTKHTTAKKLYYKLRGGAMTQVEESIPALGAVMDRHL